MDSDKQLLNLPVQSFKKFMPLIEELIKSSLNQK